MFKLLVNRDHGWLQCVSHGLWSAFDPARNEKLRTFLLIARTAHNGPSDESYVMLNYAAIERAETQADRTVIWQVFTSIMLVASQVQPAHEYGLRAFSQNMDSEGELKDVNSI